MTITEYRSYTITVTTHNNFVSIYSKNGYCIDTTEYNHNTAQTSEFRRNQVLTLARQAIDRDIIDRGHSLIQSLTAREQNLIFEM